jgi:hypothetical protein
MARKRAARAKRPVKRTANGELPRRVAISTPLAHLKRLDELPEGVKEARIERRKKLKELVAKLYGQGLSKQQIARTLASQWAGETAEQQYKKAYRAISRWEQHEDFRDLVYLHAVIKLDLEAPKILKGISRKARTGRVDAARLALELSGRHVPKGDSHPTQIVLAMGNIPRPAIEGEFEEVG